MMNLIALAILCLAASVHGFSKYGRSCRDIGCLGSEVCILAEDPCTIGHSSDCGTYPTCKKKSLVDGGGTNAEPARPAAPSHPVYPSPPRQDDVPNYPPPPPPRSNYPSVPAYGSNSGGYGGSNGGYGGNSGGYGSNTGGYGGSSGYGGSNGGYGGSNGGYGSDGGNTGNRGSLPSGGGDNPFSSFFNGLSGGGGASGAGASKPNGGGFVSSFLNNALNNFTRNGGLSGLSGLLSPSNTRPIVENPYYQNPNQNQRAGGSYPNNPSYPGYPGNNGGYQQHGGYNPSYSQPGSQQTGYVAKNYGKSQSARSGATTRKPASYGWNLGMSLVCLMAVIGATHH